MSVARDIITVAGVSAGVFFFFAGTVGLLRFPDTLTRLHALSKADNLGPGFRRARAAPPNRRPA
ncbi:multisubunit Na+/H+ antiporter MnhG subunit [Bradyrhizobium sp. S3.14.4]